MTQKLYLDHSYDTVFEANVISTRPAEQGASAIILDRTLFYPESGGQLSDHGVLGGLKVVDVQEQEGDAVAHMVTGDAPATGKIQGTIDWPLRFDHMQQHTGQHILSRAFIKADKLDTVGFHMGDETCTIDLDGPAPDAAAIARAEDLSNQIINENRPIDIKTMPIEEVDMSELRRKVPDGVTMARIVTVRDFDVIPCCGTHVKTTGELGMIKVLKTEKVRNFHRVHFKVGVRAFADYRDKHAVLQELSQRLTTAPLDVNAKVERLVEDGKAADKRLKTLIQRLAAADAQRLMAESGASPRVIAHHEADAALARAIATEMQKASGTVALISADDGSVVCVSSHELGIDLATPASALAKELGGSGGGKGGFAQIKLSPEKTSAFIERMRSEVLSRFS